MSLDSGLNCLRPECWQRQREPTEERLRNRIALLHGQRRLFGGIPANTNLCYASEDVQQALTGAVVAYAKAHPEADAVHFWLADTFNNLCECEACRASTLSDQYVRILNRIDAALTATRLATRIVFLLYQELLCPPREARISHPERFILMFAPISRSFETSYPRELPSGSCPTFPRNAMTLPLSIRATSITRSSESSCLMVETVRPEPSSAFDTR